MFHSELYAARRHALAARMSGGLLLFVGNDEAPTNFRANVYPFVQDGCFAYFFGIVRPGLAGVIDVDAGTSWLFGDDAGIDAAIWMGAAPRIAEQAMTIGAAHGGTLADLVQLLSRAREQARAIVYPPVYSDATLIKISAWLGPAAFPDPRSPRDRTDQDDRRAPRDQGPRRGLRDRAGIVGDGRDAPCRDGGDASGGGRA